MKEFQISKYQKGLNKSILAKHILMEIWQLHAFEKKTLKDLLATVPLSGGITLATKYIHVRIYWSLRCNHYELKHVIVYCILYCSWPVFEKKPRSHHKGPVF